MDCVLCMTYLASCSQVITTQRPEKDCGNNELLKASDIECIELWHDILLTWDHFPCCVPINILEWLCYLWYIVKENFDRPKCCD